LLADVSKLVKQHSFYELDDQFQVLLSSFGEDASLIGGTAIVVDDILSDPIQVERR
jgi:hypothetical protein